jgi:hypothetical protein
MSSLVWTVPLKQKAILIPTMKIPRFFRLIIPKKFDSAKANEPTTDSESGLHSLLETSTRTDDERMHSSHGVPKTRRISASRVGWYF